MPMLAASTVTLITTSNDVRAPWTIPASTSRPRSSVPKAWAREGGDSGGATDANGSAGASVSARIASVISAKVRTSPSTPAGVRHTALVVADTRVEPGIRHVGHEIGDDDRHRGEQEEAEKNGNV